MNLEQSADETNNILQCRRSHECPDNCQSNVRISRNL